MPNAYDAGVAWASIPGLLTRALTSSPKDFVTLECCANAQAYAKSDLEKQFLLWEMKKSAVKIETAPDLELNHPWLYRLFVDGAIVRLPFNTRDSESSTSISWDLVAPLHLPDNWHQRLKVLPRFSTASRSCLALIPERLDSLADIQPGDLQLVERARPLHPNDMYVDVKEWTDFERTLRDSSIARFGTFVRDIGAAASPTGVTLDGRRYRLYSVKTGVSYVGSTNEAGHGKDRLEANCSMAMVRSRLAQTQPNKDATFGIQGELLTITGPLSEHGQRDGVQVRDLSCLWPRLTYLPAQAMPYVRRSFEGGAEPVAFWRKNFAVPLGRAKGRLFLQYGLVHTSANAQNFVLGFAGSSLRHFVARDVGDTSWHDDYLTNYLRWTSNGAAAYKAFQAEAGSEVWHTLRATSSGAYPPPQLVRLATYSVLTHNFGQQLGWSNAQLLDFAAGVLDGFRAFIEEALELAPLYGATTARSAVQVAAAGNDGKYPHPMDRLAAYTRAVDTAMQQPSATLLAWASYVSQNRDTLRGTVGGGTPVSTVINAEEFWLCAGIEQMLREICANPDKTQLKRIRKRLMVLGDSGKWPAVVDW